MLDFFYSRSQRFVEARGLLVLIEARQIRLTPLDRNRVGPIELHTCY